MEMNHTPICRQCGEAKEKRSYESVGRWLERKFCTRECAMDFARVSKTGFHATGYWLH